MEGGDMRWGRVRVCGGNDVNTVLSEILNKKK